MADFAAGIYVIGSLMSRYLLCDFFINNLNSLPTGSLFDSGFTVLVNPNDAVIFAFDITKVG
ncbi:hypothetical protein LVD17_24095 [Fulvivirga ulvae]|uniref:hypothetical protein n=1 Tax=Fulvivirga ulvae TaxID=2904245 RepID=UPI001F27C86A|nr:hypothetical protein [Fulvivirga ulvae]UII31379.1 hypothetical protein LVD17_24095 [Fulvivirga ulvae]